MVCTWLTTAVPLPATCLLTGCVDDVAVGMTGITFSALVADQMAVRHCGER